MNTLTYEPAGLMLKYRRQEPGLCFTEWLLVAALAVAYLFSMSSPIFGIQLQISSIKHLPMILLAPALALHCLGVFINRSHIDAAGIFRVTWSLVLMACLVITGSLVARQALGVVETFLTLGVYLLLLPIFAAVPARHIDAVPWAKAVTVLWIGAGLAGLVGESARFAGDGGLLHEIEFIVASAFFLMFYVVRSVPMKVIALLLMIVAAGLNQKLTGYILTIAALLYMLVAWGWARSGPRWRGFYISLAGTTVVGVVCALVLGYFEFRAVLPTGNPEVRLQQYEQAMRQFFASPIWGSAYLEGSGEVFIENARALNIPTHSDVLDMLKHGGVIAFSLFFWAYWRIFRVLSRAIVVSRQHHLLHAFFSGLRFFQFGALVTFSLNPLLLKGPFQIVICSSLGLGVGLALMMLRNPPAPRP